MAVVGEAHIIVRAITNKVSDDIKNGFNGVDRNVAAKVGNLVGRSFSSGFKNSGAITVFGKIADGIESLAPKADGARTAFRKLSATGYTLTGAIGLLAGGISSLGVGLVSLISAGAAAVQGLGVVAMSFVQLRIAAFTASFALAGISQAVAKATGASSGYGKSIAQVRKELNQLKLDSEDASLSEERAAMNLEKAREAVARVMDLPPNSRARREAELALKEADLAYRKAKERTIDLQDQVEEGVQPSPGVDPYAGLTAAQEKFARFLVSIQPEIKNLRDKVAEAFLGPLEVQIGRIVDEVFPMLEKKLPLVAGAFATAAGKFTDVLVKQENIDQLGRVLEGMVPGIENWGTIFGNIYEIALDIAEALNPIVTLFTEDLIKVTDEWKKKIDEMSKSGELESIFQRGYDVLKKLGEIAGNVLGGIGNLLDLNFGDNGSGGGWVVLNWLDTVTEKFQNLGGDTEEGRKAMSDFFEGAAINATSVMDAIGAYIGEIIKLADNPAIKEAFDILKAGAPEFGELLRKSVETAPQFADLIVKLIDLGNALQDSGAVKAFFEVLTGAVEAAVGFFSSPFGQSVLTFTGRVFAVGVAFSTILGPIKFFGNVVAGNVKFAMGAIDGLATGLLKVGRWPALQGTGVSKAFLGIADAIKSPGTAIGLFGLKIKEIATGALGLLKTGFSSLTGIIANVGRAIGAAFIANPIGIVIAAVAALVAGLIWFFTQTEVGKEMWANFTKFLSEAWDNTVKFFQEAVQNFVTAFQGIWEGIVSFFQPVIDGFTAAFTVAFDIIRGVVEVFVAVFTIIFVLIGTVVQAVWDGIVAGWNAAVAFLTPVVEAIGSFFGEIFKNIGDFIGTVWDGIKTAFDTMWGLLKVVVKGVKDFFTPIFKGIGDFVGGIWTGIQTGFQKFVDWIKPPLDKIFGFFKTVFGNVENFLKTTINTLIGFAEGFVNFFIRGLNWIISKINTIKLKIPELMQPLFGGKKEIGFNITPVGEISLPRLAKGGTVFPSSGGSIVNVAEAGRPERIEPLDPDGLSKRDKAMIQELSGGLGGGITINVHPSAGMDERELAQLVSRELAFKIRRGGI